MNIDQFDIEQLVLGLTDKEPLHILDTLNREVARVESINVPKITFGISREEIIYHKNEYVAGIKDFLFFVHTGLIPHSTGISGIKRFITLLSTMVDVGFIKKDLLDLVK